MPKQARVECPMCAKEVLAEVIRINDERGLVVSCPDCGTDFRVSQWAISQLEDA